MNMLSATSKKGAASSVPWWLLVVGAGVLIPGSALVIGAILGFTKFRNDRPALRWSFLLVGAAMLVIQLISLRIGFSSHSVSPATRVS